ncbi:hypothetical protein KOR42_12940 [Thalassoglobus neptunius]|uniref:Uncharacterized protein n=1 Tax=Thalassoglobus neptunius TaxID=1938619 RepID=A0A5C5X4J9_9PLAN|nr:hypothetical protein KOR42_12940 [Thalassoglobus neptunius]
MYQGNGGYPFAIERVKKWCKEVHKKIATSSFRVNWGVIRESFRVQGMKRCGPKVYGQCPETSADQQPK